MGIWRWGAGSLSLPWLVFEADRTGFPNRALATLPSFSEGGDKRMVVSRLCLLFCLVERVVEQSYHPFPERCGFHVPAWHHFLRTLHTRG